MAEREQDNRLEELEAQGIPLYSISRIDSINHCLYGAYRTYDLGERGYGNVYSCAGTVTHDTLEAITKGEKTEADLLPAIQDELENLDMLGIEFPKGKDGSETIKQGWVDNMTHFATTYKAPKGTFKTEQLFIYKTKGGNHLIGYIDLQRINKDGSIDIYDYKTSSMYKGEDLKSHGRQLLVYAAGKMQEGYMVNSVSWIMLKYADITFMGYKTAKSKEKTEIKRTIERRKIGSEMAKYVEMDMIQAGYDEIDIDVAITELKQTNMFTSLPDEIAANYKMTPCVMRYELTYELLNECDEYIDNTIKMWEGLNHTSDEDFKPRKFTKLQKNGKEVGDYFFCTSLCEHFKNCVYIHDYLDSLQSDNNDDEEDLF